MACKAPREIVCFCRYPVEGAISLTAPGKTTGPAAFYTFRIMLMVVLTMISSWWQ
jgi:hypothetical protein